MKTVLSALLISAAVMAACSSGNNNQKDDYIAKRDTMLQRARHPKVERMPDYSYNSPIQWSAADTYIIKRQAVDSLGTVRDDEGNIYCNNSVRLVMTRGSETFFQHTFTKADFASMGYNQFFHHAVLTGMAFDSVGQNCAHFIASVGMPESDEYVQFAITIDTAGGYMIEPTEVLDDTLLDEES